MTTTLDVHEAALLLHDARAEATAVPQLTDASGVDLSAAYAVQAAGLELRVRDGERCIGVKLGLTSRAKMQQVGVDEVILGRLTDAMAVPDGGTVELGRFIHSRAEPEIAFRLGREVLPNEAFESAVSAFDAVAPAVEIIDSRYADFRFTLEDVVADNASAVGYVLGPWSAYGPAGPDISNRGTLLEVDGRVVATGSTAAILGDPRRALAAVISLARSLGIPLPVGAVLLAGAATAAVPLAPGQHVRAVVAGLGTASFTCAPGQGER
ncbi:MAG: fumarylacetoacetate hydrolase family protein [Nocardioides sp.]